MKLCRQREGLAALERSKTIRQIRALIPGIYSGQIDMLQVKGDLTSSAGKLTMGVINAIAQFERDLLIERTQSGLTRAKSAGKTLGRPAQLGGSPTSDRVRRIGERFSVSALAKRFSTSRQSIMRARDDASQPVLA